MKHEVAYKNQNVNLKINIYLNLASTLPFRSVLQIYRSHSCDLWANERDGFYSMATLDWNIS